MQGQHGEVCVIDVTRLSSQLLLGFCCRGKWPVSPSLLLLVLVVVNIAVAVILMSFVIVLPLGGPGSQA